MCFVRPRSMGIVTLSAASSRSWVNQLMWYRFLDLYFYDLCWDCTLWKCFWQSGVFQISNGFTKVQLQRSLASDCCLDCPASWSSDCGLEFNWMALDQMVFQKKFFMSLIQIERNTDSTVCLVMFCLAFNSRRLVYKSCVALKACRTTSGSKIRGSWRNSSWRPSQTGLLSEWTDLKSTLVAARQSINVSTTCPLNWIDSSSFDCLLVVCRC